VSVGVGDVSVGLGTHQGDWGHVGGGGDVLWGRVIVSNREKNRKYSGRT